MGKNIIIFVLCFVVGFGGGYLIFGTNKDQAQPSKETEKTTEPSEKTDEEVKDDAIAQQQGDASDNEGRILTQKGCIACHSVSSLNLQGGATGPDLSQAYVNVEGKHGVPLEEFLTNPTSAVMSSVLGGEPLTDDERTAVIEALKVASEK